MLIRGKYEKVCGRIYRYVFLVLFVTGAIMINDITCGVVTNVGIGLRFGFIVMSLIYAIGDISGAHINPAVTLSFFVHKMISFRDTVSYVLFQFSGGIAASLVNLAIFGNLTKSMGETRPFHSDLSAFIVEIILTAFLMFVIMGVSTGAKEKGIMAGFAVGTVVALEAMFAGPFTGASMNPARSLAPAIFAGYLGNIWVYILGPIVGAFIGSMLYRLIKVAKETD